MEIKQEESDFLDVSFIKEEFIVEDLQATELQEEQPLFEPSNTNHIKTESEIIPFENTLKDLNEPHIRDENGPFPIKLERNVATTTNDIQRNYECIICAKTFNEHHLYVKHNALHNEGNLSCSVCSKEFKIRKFLQNHMLKHAEQTIENCVCEICNKSYSGKEKLKIHMFKHRNAKKVVFECDYCEKKYYKEANRDKHMTECHKRKKNKIPQIFTCADCGKIFKRKYNYEMHLQVHSNVSFNCSFCTKTYKQKILFDRHMTLHEEGKLFICGVCGKTFDVEYLYRRHMTSHEKKVHPCLYCNKILDTNVRRLNHIRSVHRGLPTRIKDVPLVCKICKIVFDTIEILIEHVKEHSINNRYECRYCGTKFETKRKILKHIREEHEGQDEPTIEPELSCEKCGKVFHMLHTYEMHTKSAHTDVKQFVCSFCEEGFKVKDDLVKHLRKHKKIFSCKQCGKRYEHRCSLKKHERQHSIKVNVFHCPHCSESFRHVKPLEKHVEKFHGDLETAIDSSVGISALNDQKDPLCDGVDEE